MNGAEPPVNFPLASCSGSSEPTLTEVVTEESTRKEVEPHAQTHQMCADVNASQDYAGGMMKIVPSDVDVSVIMMINLFSLLSN